MATARRLQHLQAKQSLATSLRLGVPDSPGIALGRLVAGGQLLYPSIEDMITVIAGARVGKSTSLVIPAIALAPGAVITTSNKRDVLDATRDLRTDAGPVWVFDPQGVAREEASWWWNPLSYVTDDVIAAAMIDRLVHHAEVITLTGDSYRTRSRRQLLANGTAPPPPSASGTAH